MRPWLIPLAFLLAACGSDLTAPAGDSTCSNPLEPPAFRAVYATPPGAAIFDRDTAARTENRYILPHRSADTIPFRNSKTGEITPGAFMVIRFPVTYCVTLMDSIAHYDKRIIEFLIVQ